MTRQLALLDYAVGSLTRRRAKSTALTLGLAFTVALFASALFLTGALEREYEAAADHMPDLTVQALVAGRPALIDVSVAEDLRGLPAVRSVTPRVWGYYFFTAIEANITIVGAEVREGFDDAVAEGRLPRAPGEVAVGDGLADALGLRVGDEMGIPVDGRMLFSDVVGVFGADTSLRTADLVVTTSEHARTLLGVPAERATDLAIDLTTEEEAPVVTRRVAQRLAGARVLDRRLLRRAYELTFDTRGGLLATLLLPALAAFLLLAWERLSGLSAAERREIGVLKAVGWSTSDVLSVRMWESGLMGVGGAMLGLVTAYAYVFLLGAPGMADALLGWSALHPSLRLTPAFDGLQALSLLAGIVLPFISLSVVPAWRAAMLDPDRAIRGGG